AGLAREAALPARLGGGQAEGHALLGEEARRLPRRERPVEGRADRRVALARRPEDHRDLARGDEVEAFARLAAVLDREGQAELVGVALRAADVGRLARLESQLDLAVDDV